MTGKTVTPVTSPVTIQPGNSLSPDSEYITHTVRSGDTIWDIVRLYGNISTTDVLTLNNITDPEKIKVGQVLKIRKKS
jgi:LysM repeat protein